MYWQLSVFKESILNYLQTTQLPQKRVTPYMHEDIGALAMHILIK